MQRLNIPAAIIIAGGLIVFAVYFSNVEAPTEGSRGITRQATQPSLAQPENSVGNFRPITYTDHIRGPENATVTVLEYSDLECPFCKLFHPTMQQLLREYPNDVRWVYRHAPIVQLHSKAPKEAEATECAAEQGKFWELVDIIFEVTPANNGLDLAELPKLAKQAGVAHMEQWQACFDGGKYAKHVEEDTTDARVAGLQGTPYSVIIGKDGATIPFSGAQPYSALKQVVDRALSSQK